MKIPSRMLRNKRYRSIAAFMLGYKRGMKHLNRFMKTTNSMNGVICHRKGRFR